LAELCREISQSGVPPERFFTVLVEAGDVIQVSDKRPDTFRLEFLALLEAMVRHPNIPLELLNADDFPSLLEACPDAFLANPIAPLLPLEHPNIAEFIGPTAMAHLLIRADVPPSYIALGKNSHSPLVRDAVAHHILNVGEADPDGPAWQEAAQNIVCNLFLSSGQTGMLWELLGTGNAPGWLQERLASQGLVPWWHEGIFPDLPEAQARTAAMDPATPLTTLEALTQSHDAGVRLAVWFNPSTTHSLRDEYISLLLQKRLSCLSTGWENRPPDLMSFLALASVPWNSRYLMSPTGKEGARVFQNSRWDYLYPAVRLALAVNPHTPADIRASLATREGHRIVRAAAQAYLKHGKALL
jgi:hypothetical protein